MISQRELSLISNELYEISGGRRIPEQVIELDYALGWFLSELPRNSFSNQLAFKGGTALRRCYFGEYRFSEDLDFTLLTDSNFEDITTAFNEVGAAVHEASGMEFRFSRPDGHQHVNSHKMCRSPHTAEQAYVENTGFSNPVATFI